MASPPNINHNKRYQELLKEMKTFSTKAESQESELKRTAEQMRMGLGMSGIDPAVKATLEYRVERMDAQIISLQERRAQSVNRLISKASNAFEAMMSQKADQDLNRTEVILQATKQHAEFSKVLRSIQRYISKQVQTSLDLYRKMAEELNDLRSHITDQITKAINDAIVETQNARNGVKYAIDTLTGSSFADAANDETAPVGTTLKSMVSHGKKAANQDTFSSPREKANDSLNPSEYEDFGPKVKTPKKSSYERIKDEALTERLIRALEVLSIHKKYSMQQGAGVLLGGFMAAGLASAIWAPLKAFASFITDPKKWLQRIRNFFGKAQDKILEWYEAASGKLKSWWDDAARTLTEWKETAGTKIGEFVDSLKTKVSEWGDDAKGFLRKVGEKLGIVSPEAKGAATVAGDAGLASRATSAVSNVASKVLEGAKTVGGYVSSGARTVVNTAGNLGSSAMKAISALGARGAEFAKSAGGHVMNAIQKLGTSPFGQFLGKWVNRIGNLGMAFSTITGIMEEVEGKKVDEVKVWEAIFDPMKAGRWLGNKFNKKFEELTGTSVGSWLYDLLNSDPNYQAAVKERMSSGIQITSIGATNVIPMSPTPAQPVRIPSRNLRSSTVSSAPGAVSTSPSIVPSAIPDYMGNDPTMMGLNMYAFGA